MAKPPCPKAYFGGGRPPDLWVALPRPLAGRSPPPTWPPVTPGLVGGRGEGRGRGRSHCSPYLRPPIPLPQFFSCWAGWNSPPHSLLLSRGRGRGKAFTVVPIYGPPPHPLPGNPACVLITQVLSSRTQAGHSAMPGSYGGGGGRAPLSSLQIRFAPLPPPPSLGGWRQQPARAV